MNPDRPGTPSAGPWTVPWLRIGLYVVVSRVFLFILAAMAVHVVTPGPAGMRATPLELFRHWDASWYITIATEGYQQTREGPYSTAFFPLYPLMMHGVGYLCRDPRAAGYLISNACLFGSCLMLWKLVARDDRREDIADRAVLLFLFNPVAMFYSSIYSESLFFLLMVGAVYFATGRRWIAAGCCGFFASLCRPVGILLAVAFVAEFVLPYLRRKREAPDAPSWPAPDAPRFLAGVALVFAGLGVYMLYLAICFDDPFAFLHAQAHWHREFSTPWATLMHMEYGKFYAYSFHAAAVAGLLLVAAGVAVRLRPAYSVLCLFYMAVYLSTLHLESIVRFLSVLFPFYITLARLGARYPRLEPLILAGSAMLLALSTILFADGYWLT